MMKNEGNYPILSVLEVTENIVKIHNKITGLDREFPRSAIDKIKEYVKGCGVSPKEILIQIINFKHDEYGTHEALYLEIRKFIEDHLDLVEDAEYDILTAKAIESWLIEKFDTVGYLFFIGPPRSGKSRAEEVLASICYNSLLSATMTGPAIYRTLDKGTATLFLDEIQQYIKDDKATFLAILNAGQRRGQRATIVVKTREGYEAKTFEVFGSKILAATDLPTEALSTRCIMIPMVKNSRKVAYRIDNDKAQLLKRKLAKFKEDWKDKEIPNLEDIFLNNGFHDYRNIETFINLVAVTPEKYRDRILSYAKGIDEQIAEEDGINFYADLYKAIKKALPKMKSGKLAINDIAQAYNEDLPESEQLSNNEIGKHVIIMGLKNKCRMSDGSAARTINERLMERLRRRYSPLQTKIEEKTEESEHSDETYVSNTLPLFSSSSQTIQPPVSSDSSESSELQTLGDTLPILQEAFRQIEETSTDNWEATIINFMMCDMSYAEDLFKHFVDNGDFLQGNNGNWRYVR
jgi:hypothetical protein